MPVSLVIAGAANGPDLVACIESFERAANGQLEIIVSCPATAADIATVRARFPRVRILEHEGSPSIPALRAAGLAVAGGDVIAMTAAHCRADADWLPALLRAYADAPDAAAIGGALDNRSTARLLDCAVFFCEYGRFLPPFPSGPAADLPGTNVSYTRRALEAISDLRAPATWETLWHWRLQSRGLRSIRNSSVLVWHTRRYELGAFLVERYHFARSFAGQRVRGRSRPIRLAFAAGTVCLPALLVARVLARVLPKGRHTARLLLSLPYLLAFGIAGAIGEFAGYLAGPGRSAERIG